MATTRNWEVKNFERDFYMVRLKDYKEQRKKIKTTLRELDEEIKEIEYILMDKVRGGNKEIKLPIKLNSITEK